MTDEATGVERLDLADWRRRVSDLYGAVRAEAACDAESAWNLWRTNREVLFREHSQSPIPPADRAGFRAHHWPYDARLRFEVTLAEARGDPPEHGRAGLTMPMSSGFGVVLPISSGGEEALTRIGRLVVPFPDGDRSLGAYWMAGYTGGLFLPFRDQTNGHETYGAGRYLLDTAKSADLGPGVAPGSLVVDFNFAFHPSCAFDPHWSCPLAPPENRLDIRIEAGERLA